MRYIYINDFYPNFSLDENDPLARERRVGFINQESIKQRQWLISVGNKLNEKKTNLSEFRKYQIDGYRDRLGVSDT